MSETTSEPQSAPAQAGTEHPASAEDKTLDKLLAEAQARIDEHRDAWMRALAETENVRKRAQADLAAAYKFAVERFAESLLPVMDSLEAALGATEGAPQGLRDGVELTLRQLKAAFQKVNLVEIAPAPGERFDPHRHQAMAAVEAQAEPNTIVAVMLQGYSLQERVIRPALVTVAKALENRAGNPISDNSLQNAVDPNTGT